MLSHCPERKSVKGNDYKNKRLEMITDVIKFFLFIRTSIPKKND